LEERPKRTRITAEATWTRFEYSDDDEKGTCIYLTVEQVAEMIAFIVNNTFIFNDEELLRQILGIPMGTNAAPQLANLYCYSYERDYINKLVGDGENRKAQQLHNSFRLIDDLFSMDNETADDFLTPGLVYPTALILKETSLPDHVNFLGMRISNSPDRGGVTMKVYDKRRDFSFRVNNYPYLESNIPRSICYGVFSGLLHRYHRICTESSDFLDEALRLAHLLIQRGYSKKLLCRRFRQFVTSRRRKHLCYQFDAAIQRPNPKLGGNQ